MRQITCQWMGQVTGNLGQSVLQSALKTRIEAWPVIKHSRMSV